MSIDIARAAATLHATVAYAGQLGMKDPSAAQLPGALRSLRDSCDELLAVVEPKDATK